MKAGQVIRANRSVLSKEHTVISAASQGGERSMDTIGDRADCSSSTSFDILYVCLLS
jgi:hypothetical protein